MLWFAKTIVPVEEIVMSVELVYFKRFRNTCWLEVVTDDAELVETTENVNVGPVTPLIVEVVVPPALHPVHVPETFRLLNAPFTVELPMVVPEATGTMFVPTFLTTGGIDTWACATPRNADPTMSAGRMYLRMCFMLGEKRE
jgi:hypothetical protein